jgi:hypothetical protein
VLSILLLIASLACLYRRGRMFLVLTLQFI